MTTTRLLILGCAGTGAIVFAPNPKAHACLPTIISHALTGKMVDVTSQKKTACSTIAKVAIPSARAGNRSTFQRVNHQAFSSRPSTKLQG